MSRAPSISIQGSWLPWSTHTDEVAETATNNVATEDAGNTIEAVANNDAPPASSTSATQNDSSAERKYSDSDSSMRRGSSNFPSLSAANGWLGSWNISRSGSEAVVRMDEKDKESGQRSDEAIYDEEEGEDDEEDPQTGNEIDDQVNSKKSAWSFWNGAGSASSGNNGNQNNGDGGNNNNNNNNNKDGKAKKFESFSNTIVSSNHSIHSQLKGESASSSEDDAVLYKPHSNAKQFSEINTHKNENLRENVIVPDWDSCLPHQAHSLSTSSNFASNLLGSSSTSSNDNSNINAASKLDLKNWRQFLNQLSSKLGFSSQSLTSVVGHPDDDENSNNADKSSKSGETVEKEFHLLYEKTYRLYGRSLAKLPEHKRACLPNYNKYYTEEKTEIPSGTAAGSNDQQQVEEDGNDISISNDPMGNLLINHGKRSLPKPTTTGSSIHSMRAGPLVKIKKILIIGVHGFFPTKMVRPFIGSPKGTSLKFANEAEKGVIRYCIENNLITSTESNVSIQKIALEMEGKILDRVDFFTKILEKWSKEINEADFIFVASHSQGTVVSIILLARLMKLGILKDPIHKRIGVLGMAGVNNGPFYGIDKSLFMKAYSAIENESMSELFELNKFTSKQSLAYKESIQTIINANVKLCLIGSINDQLVPLYSAFANHTFHPNIYRACYIDHASQTPGFIQKLVSLCCQLQNLGFFDNNVIKELSTVLAGPLTGSGHSKIYNDGKVYDLGIKFILDTDDIVIPPPLEREEQLEQPHIEQQHAVSTLGTDGSVVNNAAASQEEVPPLPLPQDNLINSGSSNGNALVTSGIGTYGSNDQLALVLPPTNQIYIKEYNVGKIGTNPFILPWCFRGLLFNIEKNWPNNNKLLTVESGNEVGKNGYDEINDLYDLFEEWKPESKLYKDLKYRLNGIRASKL